MGINFFVFESHQINLNESELMGIKSLFPIAQIMLHAKNLESCREYKTFESELSVVSILCKLPYDS